VRRFVLLLLFVMPLAAFAQHHPTDLSEAEEEKVRDAAAFPAERIAVYQEIIEARVKRIQDVIANSRAQGRREDIKQNMGEIAGLVDEMQENLEEYQDAHRDLRKQLPKLQNAMERWVSVLKQAPDEDSYNLTRKLALEGVADVQAEVKEILPAQIAYFKEHPPDKNANPGGVGQIHHE
jgi:predicted  nucleic acid-binding Zn-ribbon protein